MKSNDRFLLVTGQWFASSLSMLVSRNAFERYRGSGSWQKDAAIPSTSSQFKKRMQTPPESPPRPPDAQSQRSLRPAGPGNQASWAAKRACCWRGARSGAKTDIKWNMKAADTKQTSPGNRDWSITTSVQASWRVSIKRSSSIHSLAAERDAMRSPRLNAALAGSERCVNRPCYKSGAGQKGTWP